MNVGELKKLLDQYPDDMELLNNRFSGLAIIQPGDWGIVKAVDQGDWIMRSHSKMSAEKKAKEKEYLHFNGN